MSKQKILMLFLNILFINIFYINALNLSNLTKIETLLANELPTKKLINVDALKKASLGRVAQLGEFYDARTDNFVGINLFATQLAKQSISSIENAFTDLKFTTDDSLQNKFNQLDVEASLKLSVLGGKVNLGGSAKYLKDTKSSSKSARISLIESINTRFESISVSDTSVKQVVNFDALSQFDVTHVVTGIQWGGKIIVTVEDSNQANEDNLNVQGRLHAEVQYGMTKITGEAKVNYTDDSFSKISKYSFNLFGDILPDRVPENIIDALLFMNNTPSLLKQGNDGRGKQIFFMLTPVNVLRQLWELEIKESAFVHEINDQIVDRCVQLFDDMNSIEQQLNDYYTDISQKEALIRDDVLTELTHLKGNYSLYQTMTTKVLSSLLVEIRSGNASVSELENILLKSFNDSYSKEAMKLKLQKYNILNNQLLLTGYVANISSQCIIDKHTNLEKMLLENQDKNVYVLYYNYEHNTRLIQQDNMDAILSYRTLVDKKVVDNVYCSMNYEIVDANKTSMLNQLNRVNNRLQLGNNDQGQLNKTQAKISLYKHGKLINENILPIDGSNGFIYVCGGYDGQQFFGNCHRFDILLNTWSTDTEVDTMLHKRHYLKLLEFNNMLYAIGGRDQNSTNWVENYDTITKVWRIASSLNMRRDGLGAAVINNTIYVCGGLCYDSDQKYRSINSCEYYTPEANEWMFSNPMSVARDFLELVAHDNCLYAIGGSNNNNFVQSVEKYDPIRKTWTVMANMSTVRSSFGAVSFMDKIYVCGGRVDDGDQSLNTCEAYDSQENKWSPIASMQVSRAELQLVAYNDKLYAVGGTNINSMEIYDYKSNSWSYTIPLPTNVWAFGASMFKKY
ncbi:uncharacterized protein LOC128951849 [Oppia nitens]|uniref:uncharacterized protein LOC128951849 n=1 Tax=Oppia nitens TaxID=1686743 RepID=UPI0023DB5B2C|nr:uncharacterized protein LOC128951849 [Oppia nitens]